MTYISIHIINFDKYNYSLILYRKEIYKFDEEGL